MPPYLPPAERSRQRLVEGIRGLDVVKRRSVRGGGRHLLFFAYALAMQVGLLSSFFLSFLFVLSLLTSPLKIGKIPTKRADSIGGRRGIGVPWGNDARGIRGD